MGMTRELRSNTRAKLVELPNPSLRKSAPENPRKATWQSHGVLSPALSEAELDSKDLDAKINIPMNKVKEETSKNPLCLSDVHRALSNVVSGTQTDTKDETPKKLKYEEVICPQLPVPPRRTPLEQVPGIPRLCTYCGATKTPLWRAGPKGFNILCNRCGIIWKRGRILQDIGSGGSHTHATHKRMPSKGLESQSDAQKSASTIVRHRRSGVSGLESSPTYIERLQRRKLAQKASSLAFTTKKRYEPVTPKPYHIDVSPLKSYRPPEMDVAASWPEHESDTLTCSSLSGYSSDAYSEWDSGVSDTEQVPAGMSVVNSGARSGYRYNAPVPSPVIEPVQSHHNRERLSRQRAAYLNKKIETLSPAKLLPVVDILRSTPVWKNENMEGKLERGLDAEIQFGDVSEDVWNKIAKLVGGEPKMPGQYDQFVFPIPASESTQQPQFCDQSMSSILPLSSDQFGQTLLGSNLSLSNYLEEPDALEEYLVLHAAEDSNGPKMAAF